MTLVKVMFGWLGFPECKVRVACQSALSIGILVPFEIIELSVGFLDSLHCYERISKGVQNRSHLNIVVLTVF